MFNFLKLIRAGNLIFIALTMFLIKYGLFEPFGVAITLNLFGFSMLVLAVVCVAASGYVINDIFDIPADIENKPDRALINTNISEKVAYRLFFILSIVGVGLGFYLSNMIGRPGFSAFFIFGSAILYIYNSQLQQTILVGNILVSIIVGLIPVGVGLYDLLPAITPQNQQTQSTIFSILIDYSMFAFLVNLLREIVKDQEDINGDYNAGYKTLPIVLGKKRTNIILFITGLIPLGFLIYYTYQYLFENVSAVIYVLLLLVAPLLFFLVNIWSAEKKSEYKRLSFILKMVLFFGLTSIGLLQFILL
ncbi:geranylgeranylglycerol-phosphate geranylgeranyltransferase [Christiangramia forsetii]|uniref:UbiA family prenyltransferase n=2 Tax=Christiangramia forsetii TaxID=411153 RepID=A0M2D7_CHRFK|nr:geranylgeranylglycerol-phosphate geranylgeranyltransferase [Christiangramia forsetii]GGG39396.1 prenyltransferase [Christiangramia forsetii]CAL66782.1 UbiA family prenyltransferase [Christiangramia forsetii KT0803]